MKPVSRPSLSAWGPKSSRNRSLICVILSIAFLLSSQNLILLWFYDVRWNGFLSSLLKLRSMGRDKSAPTDVLLRPLAFRLTAYLKCRDPCGRPRLCRWQDEGRPPDNYRHLERGGGSW